MREFPYKTLFCAMMLGVAPSLAHAAGLGKFTLLSSLGQPLSAEIDIVSVQKDELPTLTARLAPPEAFQEANIQYSPALIGVRLNIERRANGSPYVRLVSTRPVNDPFLAVLVELSWGQGRILREYTTLIDPVGFSPTGPVAQAQTTPPAVSVTPLPAESKPAEPRVQEPAAKRQPAATTPRPERSRSSAQASAPQSPAPGATASEYEVKRGDTLAKIASSVKPENVTLEQMLVSLYRNNTDAFVGNMNRLKTGKILRVPDAAQAAETGQPEAVKEVRVQTANWNSYRQKLADAAPAVEEGGKSAAAGKITGAAEDKAAAASKPGEVLKLSKGEAPAGGKPGAGKPASGAERMRMLEEEAIAREKALAEANNRVAQLEKNIKDMQRLLEMKGAVPPSSKPAVAPPPVAAITPPPPAKAEPSAKAEPAKADAAKADAAKADAAKADAAKADAVRAQQAAKPEPIRTDAALNAPKDAGKASDGAKTDQAAVADKPPVTDPAKVEAPKEAPVAVAPKPKVVAPPPPPPEPDLVDQAIAVATDPLYLAGALGGLLVLGTGAYLVKRRSRQQIVREDRMDVRAAPKISPAASAAMAAAPAASVPVAALDDVDPLAEADLYLNFGRDAQAEEVLKEALEKNPRHEEAQLKLLQIYAARKDKSGFERIARDLHTQTSGLGDNWLKAAAMGYAFDAENTLYEAGKSAPMEPAHAVAAGGGTDLDFDLELAPDVTVNKPDISLDSALAKTQVMRPGELASMAEAPEATIAKTQDITSDSAVIDAFKDGAASVPDFTLNVPVTGAATVTDITLDGPNEDTMKTNVTGDSAMPMVSVIDFNFGSTTGASARPAATTSSGFKQDSTAVVSPENQDKAAALHMDLDLGSPASLEGAKPPGATTIHPLHPDPHYDMTADATPAPKSPSHSIENISFDLDEPPSTPVPASAPPASGPKDDHWYDVQTKFDLAKAYQEMGDKDGAREILQEVIKEGDAAQNAEAQQLLATLA